MKINKYLLILIIIGSLCTLGLTLLLFKTTPQGLGWPGIIFFLILFFGMSFSFASTLGFYVRLFYTNNEFFYGNFYTSLRQGAEIAFFLVALLFLQALRIFNIIVFLLLVACFIFFELYFLGADE